MSFKKHYRFRENGKLVNYNYKKIGWKWVFKLVRLPNLLIVAATQFLIYYCLLSPVFENYNLTGSFTSLEFNLFVITTLFITAGGYIINDLFDIETDRINKPEQRIIEVHINHRSAWFVYLTLLLSGAFISLFLAIRRGDLTYWFIYPLATIILYAYSKWFKGIPLFGNFIVSLFCGAIAGLFFLTEKSAFAILKESNPDQFKNLQIILFSYTLFAFSTNFLREIVKDLQDEPGDMRSNIHTAAVVWGKRVTTYIAIVVALATFVYMNYTFKLTTFEQIPCLDLVSLILIKLPVIFSAIYLMKANDSKAYKKVGIWIKIIMINGLFLIAYITFHQNG